MTIQEINEYIFSKQIPLTFKYNGKKLYFECFFENFITTYEFSTDNRNFPNWFDGGSLTNGCGVSFFCIDEHDFDLEFNGLNIEQCVSNFLFWFEINKSKCKKIKYYENNEN